MYSCTGVFAGLFCLCGLSLQFASVTAVPIGVISPVCITYVSVSPVSMCHQYLCFCVCYSGPHWCGDQWPGGHAGRAGLRLCPSSVSLSGTATPGSWPLVLPAHVQVPQVFLLQKLCPNPVPLLVCFLLWFLSAGQFICQKTQ